jgi:DNA repair exonuclease SbcCD ATPase subunit
MSINQGRANTKATPEAVFAACASLATSNPEFRNEDVLSITGGGMSVVSRLVRIYKENQAVIEACDELDASTAIDLVMATNELLKAHKARTKAALAAAVKSMEESITELSDINQAQSIELETANEKLASEMESLSALRADYEKSLRLLESRNQEIEHLQSRNAELITANSKMAQQHEEKITQINEKNSERITAALEKQRAAFETEKATALLHLDTSKTELFKKQEAEIAAKQSELNSANDIIASLRQSLADKKEELAIAQNTASESLNSIQAVLDEKQNQLREAQTLNRQLITAFQREKLEGADFVADNLSNINRSAESLRPLLTDLTQIITSIIEKEKK